MNQKKKFSILILFLINHAIFGQTKPQINITFSKLLATYDFVQKLSDYYPDSTYRQLFRSSKFNQPHYTDLKNRFDTLNIFEAYQFQGYPMGQKAPVMTSSLIQRNLIRSSSVQEFKVQTFGIIPNAELFNLSDILAEFEPVYDSLIYTPKKNEFEKKLNELKGFVQQSNLADLFQAGLNFYDTKWDYAVPLDIAIIPILSKSGFSARVFLNNAVSEVPLNFNLNDILFSVVMHEIYHTLYDGESLQLKLNIESWFNNNPSKNSQYAYLLLDEALATSLGNGYAYEQITGKADPGDWYNVKYINLMAKQMYAIVKEYLKGKKPIDKDFVDQYIALYDEHFSAWENELDHLLTYRYVMADNAEDFNYFRINYRYASISQYETPINQSNLERMSQTPVTKVVVISSKNKDKLQFVKTTFPELIKWKYDPKKEFVYTTTLVDKTRLIIINCLHTSLESLLKNLIWI